MASRALLALAFAFLFSFFYPTSFLACSFGPFCAHAAPYICFYSSCLDTDEDTHIDTDTYIPLLTYIPCIIFILSLFWPFSALSSENLSIVESWSFIRNLHPLFLFSFFFPFALIIDHLDTIVRQDTNSK